MSVRQGTFEEFAEVPEYRDVNEKTVHSWIREMCDAGESCVRCLLDLATGVATMPEFFLKHIPSRWGDPYIMCVDKSPEALEIAREHLRLPPERAGAHTERS